MRKCVLAACALVCILRPATAAEVTEGLAAPSTAPAGICNAQGQFVDTVNPQITALLAQFPAGGPDLRAAIARAVEMDPSLADDVVFAARTAEASQKLAVGEGLGDAASFFAKIGLDFGRLAEARIRTAMICADARTRVGFVAATTPTAIGQGGIPGFNNAGVTTGGCLGLTISPSRPPSC
jgi:hypothetical protein